VAAGYGRTSRWLHWGMAAALAGQVALGLWLVRMQPGLDTLWRFALHKSVGITLLALVLVRLAWRQADPPPPPLPGPRWQMAAARAAHGGLYALMLAVPLTGWIASAASGIDVIAWGVTLPRIAPVSEAWQDGFFAAHHILAFGLVALVTLHAAAALWHGLRRDGTLSRMLRG
jgi:cytochrome b561